MLSRYPLVSIVTASYNQGRFIEDTILSIQKQDYPNIEHIVIDGGSTDNTLEILRKYDNKIIWISERDEGQVNAYNKGFNMVKGEIIGCLNSDDVYFYRDTVSKVVEYFEKNPDVDVVTGSTVLIDENNLVMQVYRIPRKFNYQRLLRYDYFRHPATFIRKRVLDAHKLDESFQHAFDYEYWLRISCNFKVKLVLDILAAIRRHTAMKTIIRRAECEKEAAEIRKRYIQYSEASNFQIYLSSILDYVIRAGLKCAGLYDISKIYLSRQDPKLAIDARFDHLFLAWMRQLFNHKGFGIRLNTPKSAKVR